MTFKTYLSHLPATMGIASILLILTGCATSQIGENAARGWVNKIYTADELRQNPIACLSHLTLDNIQATKFSEIKRPRGKTYQYIIAIVPKDLAVSLGDWVEIEPRRCRSGAVPEVKKNFDRGG